MTTKTKTHAEKQGKTIRRFRYLKELKQQELADKIGIPRSVLSYIENGRVAATQETLVEIARALDCFIIDLDVAEEKEPKTGRGLWPVHK